MARRRQRSRDDLRDATPEDLMQIRLFQTFLRHHGPPPSACDCGRPSSDLAPRCECPCHDPRYVGRRS